MTVKTKEKEPELFAPEKPAKKDAKKERKSAAKETLPATRAAAPPPAPPEPKNLYAAIIAAASNPAVDVDKMEKLVDLQIRIEEREAEKAFIAAFNALQFELPTITRDGLIDHGEGTTARGNQRMKARYSTYPNLMGVCRPLLKKHGFTFNNVIEPSTDGTKSDVVGYLQHIAGHKMKSHFPLTPDDTGRKNSQQARGSGGSYGKRYNLIFLLDIVSELPQDQDNDGHSRKQPDPLISPAEVQELAIALEDAGVDAEVFCEKYDIATVADLPQKRLPEVKKALADHKARKAAAAAERGSAKAG